MTRTEHEQAVVVRFSPLWVGAAPATIAPDRMLEDLVGVPVIAGCVVRAPTFAKAVNFQVVRTIPSGPVVIGKRTDIRVVEGEQTAARAPAVSYEDIGGLEREVARVREIVELPLKYSRIFEQLGILAPKGVLLYGPPGTGKTLLARAVAAESRVHFIHLNGPEVMRKFYGESEAKLREVFEEAARHAPAILFIDEIDAVAPNRAEVAGEVEKRVNIFISRRSAPCETVAGRRSRTFPYARRALRAGGTGAAARHSAGGTFGHRKNGHGACALR